MIKAFMWTIFGKSMYFFAKSEYCRNTIKEPQLGISIAQNNRYAQAVGVWFLTFRKPTKNNPTGVATWLPRQNAINHAPLIYANKFNKMAVLTMHTANICRHIVFRWQKTLIFGITWKILIIRAINNFNADKNRCQFQEPPFLESKTAASCR